MNEQPISLAWRAGLVALVVARGLNLVVMLLLALLAVHNLEPDGAGSWAFIVALQVAAVVAALARTRASWMLWVVAFALELALNSGEQLYTALASLPALLGWWPGKDRSAAVVDTYRRIVTKLFAGSALLLVASALLKAVSLVQGGGSTFLAPRFELGCLVLTVVAAVATLLKRAAAYTLWLAVTAVSFLTFALALAADDVDVAGNMLLMFGWVGGVLAAANTLDVDRSKRLGRVITGGVGALTLIVTTMLLLADDLRAFRDDMRRARFEEQCNEGAGNANACGYWGLYTVHHPDAADDLDEALQRFQELCDRTFWRGCAFTALMLKDHDWVFYDEPQPKWLERRDAISRAACDDGVPTACFVEVRALRGALRDSAIPGVRQACLEGDLASCRGDTLDRLGVMEARKELCEQGFLTYCHDTTCTRNHLFPCKYDYRAEKWNTLFYRVRVPAEGLDAACEAEDAEACFALGLNATADVNPFDEPVPVRSLDATWGRACDLGFNMACTTYALRLLDRPIEAKRDEARARQLLETACDRGDAGACWNAEVAFGRVPAREQLADLTAKAWAACQYNEEGCTAHLALRAVELGVDPYPVLQPFAVSAAEKACGYGHSYYCFVALWLYQDTISDALPFVVRRLDNATLGCRMGSAWSCRHLFHLTEMMEDLGAGDPDDLRARICPQVPDACD